MHTSYLIKVIYRIVGFSKGYIHALRELKPVALSLSKMPTIKSALLISGDGKALFSDSCAEIDAASLSRGGEFQQGKYHLQSFRTLETVDVRLNPMVS